MRDAIMKKPPSKRSTVEMRAEYDFSGGVRGKYVDRYCRGTNVVLLDPALAEASGMNDATLRDTLLQAISAYDYPPVTYDFTQEREVSFSTMRDLDAYLRSLLQSSDPRSVKDGLCGILYWGHYRTGVRDHRVERFRTMVSNDQLEKSIKTFNALDGTSLSRLKKLGLPEFRNMAFVSKLRTFLDSERYCVLDSKIASLAPLTTRLTFQPTYIPITAHNERAYAWWVNACQSLASRLRTKPPTRPVDVERGLFYLVDHGRRDLAEQYLENGRV
jgi:hypothetical protein